MPVVFEPMAAATLLGNFAGCVVGGALYRRATFLADRAGLVLASPLVTIFDDPALPSGQGSRPFDGEGVAARRVPLITAGVFQGFLFDCYSARRTGATTTGSAGRSLEGAPSASPSNLSFQAGTTPASSIIEDVAEGLYVTQLMGAGFNPTTGDYSRGASGFFIENGRIAFPVTEVNISSRLDTMLAGVDAVGDDLHWFRSLAAPTIRVRSMTVSGL
jgi:PmbA protein